MKTLALAILLLACNALASRCPDPWSYREYTMDGETTRFCWRLGGEKVDYPTALKLCREAGQEIPFGKGHLPESREQWQNEIITELSEGEKVFLAINRTNEGSCLIWRYSDLPLSLTFTNYDEFPRTTSRLAFRERCVALDGITGMWHEANCASRFRPLCLVRLPEVGLPISSIQKAEGKSRVTRGAGPNGLNWP